MLYLFAGAGFVALSIFLFSHWSCPWRESRFGEFPLQLKALKDDTPDPSASDETVARAPSAPAPTGERFSPGDVLDDRYRIIALLGRGGMGEVYRADDLKLGQQVALKFLPKGTLSVSALERLYGEVRLGRKVSHPNVCRLYDVGEWKGNHFVTMEYIDGEDLASLLRRIGQLPEGKAIEMVQEICAGLAAAHGLGVIHRDLKPANIMIDGRGNAIITDFGLAGLADDLARKNEFAGTPAYMAPEQLTEGKATHKSDLYALGLIMYEMFTGRRRFDGRSVNEMKRLHESTDPASVSRDTRSIDSIVQQVIARCLERDPKERPRSIHSVIAALPGADPLQAALDAGETPSPDMVAAAGKTGDLSPAIAGAIVAAIVALVIGLVWLKQQTELYGVRDLSRHPRALESKAQEILTQVGFTGVAADTYYYYAANDGVRELLRQKNYDPSTSLPSPLNLVYRQSPEKLVSRYGFEGDRRILPSDPPNTLPGMALVSLSPEGVLDELLIVPDQSYLHEPQPSTEWESLFELAQLDWANAESIPSSRPAPVDTDERWSWRTTVTGQAQSVTVDGAALGGRPVWFSTTATWQTEPDKWLSYRGREPDRRRDAVAILIALITIGSLVVARRNVVRGRADKRGALRLGLAIAAVLSISFLLRADFHGPFYGNWAQMTELVGLAFYRATTIAVIYLAIEPYLRREWPELLVAWSRLLRGRWDDPLVGRTILLAMLAAVPLMAVYPLLYWLNGNLDPGGFQSTLTSGRQALAATVARFGRRLSPRLWSDGSHGWSLHSPQKETARCAGAVSRSCYSRTGLRVSAPRQPDLPRFDCRGLPAPRSPRGRSPVGDHGSRATPSDLRHREVLLSLERAVHHADRRASRVGVLRRHAESDRGA